MTEDIEVSYRSMLQREYTFETASAIAYHGDRPPLYGVVYIYIPGTLHSSNEMPEPHQPINAFSGTRHPTNYDAAGNMASNLQREKKD